jgi:hypothetical protein
MNRITWHHTGGGYKPNATDLRSYHRLIDGDGRVHPGVHPISANAPGASMAAGTYAAHTRGLNRGAIGVSVCSMVGGTWENPRSSRAFPRSVQIDALVQETVALCRQYNIRPVREHVLSHAEVELTLGVKQRNKWDFDYQVLTVTRRNPIAIGDEIRREVVLQLGGTVIVPKAPPRPMLNQGDTGPHVVALQSALGIKGDGAFGPRTRSAVASFQKSRDLLPDGVVGSMTWAALGL